MFRLGTVSMRGGQTRAGTAAARPVTAVRAAGYTSTRDTPSREEKKEDRFVKTEHLNNRLVSSDIIIMSSFLSQVIVATRIKPEAYYPHVVL